MVTRIAMSVANSLALAASMLYGRPASRRRAACSVSARAAEICVAMSASMKPTPWKSTIGWPNWSRSRAYDDGVVQRGLREPDRARGDAEPAAVQCGHRDPEADALLADEAVGGDPRAVEGDLGHR